MRTIQISILFIFICMKSLGQVLIDTCSYVLYDEFSCSYIIVKSYKITNDSNDDYITWVSNDEIDSVSNEKAIHLYFNKLIGDFSLSFLLYEDLLKSSLTNRIGETFIKRIKSKETFEYLITKKNAHSSYYEKRIFVASRKEIEKFLKKKIPECCFSIAKTVPLREY